MMLLLPAVVNNRLPAKPAQSVALPEFLPPALAAAKQHANLVRWIVAGFGAHAVEDEPFREMLKYHSGLHAVAATRAYLKLCNMESELATRVLTPKQIFAKDLKAVQVFGGTGGAIHVSLRSTFHIAYLKDGLFHDPEREQKQDFAHPARLSKLRDLLRSGEWLRSRIEIVLPLIKELYGLDAPLPVSRRLHYEFLDTAMRRIAEIQPFDYFSGLDRFIEVALQHEVDRFFSEAQLAALEIRARSELKRIASTVESAIGLPPPIRLPGSNTSKARAARLMSRHVARTLASRIGRSIVECKGLLHDFV